MKSILILACLAVIFFTLNADVFAQCSKGKCAITERTVVKSAVIVTVVPAVPVVANSATTERRTPVRTTLKAVGKVAVKPLKVLRRK